jgi:hypothetical protein
MLANFYFPKTFFSHETPYIPVGIYRRFGRIAQLNSTKAAADSELYITVYHEKHTCHLVM